MPMADMVMSSTTACHPRAEVQADGVARARLPRPALPRQAYAEPSRRSRPASRPAPPAGPWSAFWPSLMSRRARRNSPNRLATDLEQGRLPNLTELRRNSCRMPGRCRRSSSRSSRLPPMRARHRPSWSSGMKAADPIDAARLSFALTDLRLPAIKLVWPDFAARSDKEGWPAARFLAALAEREIAEQARRRIERHLDEARLPPGKTFDSFEFDAVPMISEAQVIALRRWRQLAGERRQPAPVRPAGRRQIASWRRARPRAGGERLARAVHAHHRPRPAAPDRPPRPPARGSHRQARQVSPPHPR